MAGAGEQGRSGTPDGFEGGGRSLAPFAILGLLLVIGVLVMTAIATDGEPADFGSGVPRLVPPDSGVLGTDEEGGPDGDRDKDGDRDRDDEDRARDEARDRKNEARDRDGAGDRRNQDRGDERNGQGEGDGDGSDGDANGGDRGPDDIADVPPLLPPIGSDDPTGGGDGGEGIVPPLVPPPTGPVAGLPEPFPVGEEDSGDGDGDGDVSRGGSNDPDSVKLLSFDRDRTSWTVLLDVEGNREDAKEVARKAGRDRVLERAGVGVLEVEDVFKVEDDLVPLDDGEWVAFAGQFEDREDAEDLADHRDLEFDVEGVLLVPALPAPALSDLVELLLQSRGVQALVERRVRHSPTVQESDVERVRLMPAPTPVDPPRVQRSDLPRVQLVPALPPVGAPSVQAGDREAGVENPVGEGLDLEVGDPPQR